MKLLFFARHWSYLRNFESAIEELAARGHALHLAVDREESMGGRQMVERLVARYPDRLSMGNAPGPRRRRLVRAGAEDPARARLPALPRARATRRRRTSATARASARRGRRAR